MNKLLLTAATTSMALLSFDSVSAATLTQVANPGALSGTTVVEDFEDDTFLPGLSFDSSASRFAASNASQGVVPSGSFGLIEFIEDEPLNFFFANPVQSVGLWFGNDDFGLIFDATLQAFDASNSLLGSVSLTSNGNDFVDQFLGLNSDMAISRIALSYARPDAGSLAIFVDDLTYAAAETSAPIPTPALLPGLIGMGVAALRKKRQQEVAE